MKRKPYNKLELATGFLMGSITGLVLEFGVLALYNRFCWWPACQATDLPWWLAIPVPVFLGYQMAIAIASLHLEDY